MPHDLLKAFHLREMKDENEQVKINAVARWENYREADLANLFCSHLYPLTRWYKGKNGLICCFDIELLADQNTNYNETNKITGRKFLTRKELSNYVGEVILNKLQKESVFFK